MSIINCLEVVKAIRTYVGSKCKCKWTKTANYNNVLIINTYNLIICKFTNIKDNDCINCIVICRPTSSYHIICILFNMLYVKITSHHWVLNYNMAFSVLINAITSVQFLMQFRIHHVTDVNLCYLVYVFIISIYFQLV